MAPKKGRGAGKAEESANAVPESDRLDERSAVLGVPCWIRDGDTREMGPYACGDIIAKEGPDTYTVKLTLGQNAGKTRTVSLTELMGANEQKPFECHDLTKLLYIHEAAVSDVLQKRYVGGQIFTNVGAMLLVTNPFR